MIKTYVAYTTELDDAQIAVEQIKSQLPENLLKNSLGIIACHNEFVFSGVVNAIGEALPFDVVGAISSAQSVGKKTDTLILTIMVITSDDVEFENIVTPSLAGEPGEVISKSYKEAASVRYGRPALVLAYAPFMRQNSGDDYVTALTKASYGAPCFGTIATDETETFEACYTIFNGEHFPDKMVMSLIYGSFKPKFFIANISPDNILDKSAVVTKSKGHIIMEVNDRPVADFFESLGLAKASETPHALSSLPFLLDYHDGTPKVSKVFVSMTPEKYALCAGAVPEGCTMYITTNEREDILFTAGRAADEIVKQQNAAGVLIYSCVTRTVTMGSNRMAEVEKVYSKLGEIPMLMAYSGGEICPTTDIDSKSINRFHNNALIACVF